MVSLRRMSSSNNISTIQYLLMVLKTLIISVSDPVLQSENPFIVRLLFEPSGRPESNQDYYLTAKENICVVCGKKDSYIRLACCYSPFCVA